MTQQYEIRIRGRVRPALLEDFDGLEQSVERVETVLHGPVVDQAALHGLLQRIEALGLELVEVRRLPPAD
jgi:cell division FtsZ-interacting protein ZapD